MTKTNVTIPVDVILPTSMDVSVSLRVDIRAVAELVNSYYDRIRLRDKYCVDVWCCTSMMHLSVGLGLACFAMSAFDVVN